VLAPFQPAFAFDKLFSLLSTFFCRINKFEQKQVE
jgi:hypothetical protein